MARKSLVWAIVLSLLAGVCLGTKIALRGSVLQLVRDSCSNDEFGMDAAIQRGCRKVSKDGTDVCCGSCDRSICKTSWCAACKVDKDAAKKMSVDGVSFNPQPEGAPKGSYTLPIQNPLDILHTAVSLGLTEIPVVGGYLNTFLGLFWPSFSGDVWSQIQDKVDKEIDAKIIALLKEKLFDKNSGAAYNIQQVKDRVGDVENIRDNIFAGISKIKDAFTTLTSGASISKYSGFPLAVSAGVLLIMFERASLDFFVEQKLSEQVTATRKALEDDVQWVMKTLVPFGSSDYLSNYQTENLVLDEDTRNPYDYHVCYKWDEGSVKFCAPTNKNLENKDAIKQYILNMMQSAVMRMMAPLCLIPSMVDDSLPPVLPVSLGMPSSVEIGPFHPWMASNNGECCTKLNDWQELPMSSLSGFVHSDIDGIVIDGVSGGKCSGDKCYTYSVPSSDMLSAIVKSNDNFPISIRFNFEDSVTYIAGEDNWDQIVVFESPFAGLSSDRFRITHIRTEKPSARYLSFKFGWKGTSPTVDLSNLPTYGKPSSDFTKFLKDLYESQ